MCKYNMMCNATTGVSVTANVDSAMHKLMRRLLRENAKCFTYGSNLCLGKVTSITTAVQTLNLFTITNQTCDIICRKKSILHSFGSFTIFNTHAHYTKVLHTRMHLPKYVPKICQNQIII